MRTAQEVIYDNVLQHGLDAGITEDIAQIVAREMSKQSVYQKCLKDYAAEALDGNINKDQLL